MTARTKTALVLAGASVGMVGAVRRVGHRSGATTSEVHGRLPGDELVPEPLWTSTRAITIDAPTDAVWPWVVQMGFPAYRAGWYTPYWLDRLQWGIKDHSANEIREDLQTLAVGDRVPDSIDWSVFFTVEVLEPERALVLRSTRHLLPPMKAIDFTWAFILEPVATERTRLVIRARARYAPRWSWVILGAAYQLGDYANTTSMLHAIKKRAERNLPSIRGSSSRCSRLRRRDQERHSSDQQAEPGSREHIGGVVDADVDSADGHGQRHRNPERRQPRGDDEQRAHRGRSTGGVT